MSRTLVLFAKLSFFIAPLVLTSSCSTKQTRIAEFRGRLAYADSFAKADSATPDSTSIRFDLVTNGFVRYDRQIDGVFDDSIPIYTDESGEFGGVLLYDSPLELLSDWIRKPVRVTFPDLLIDTVLHVDAYLPGSIENDLLTDWGAILIPRTDSTIDTTDGANVDND